MNNWLDTKKDEIEHLLNLKSLLLDEQVGKSHKIAAEERARKTFELDRIVGEMIDCQNKALERNKVAMKQLQEDNRKKLEPVWIKRELLKSVKQVEDLRSKYVVAKQREKPVLILNEYQSSTIKQRDYKNSRYHCDYSVTNAKNENLQNIPNVFINAQLETQNQELSEEQFEKQRKHYANIANQRYQKAINTVLIERVLIFN